MKGYINVVEKNEKDCLFFLNLCDYMYSDGCVEVDDMASTIRNAMLETLGLCLTSVWKLINKNNSDSIKIIARTDSESLFGIHFIDFLVSFSSKSYRITINIEETLEYLLYESGKLENYEEVFISRAWMNPLSSALETLTDYPGYRSLMRGYGNTYAKLHQMMERRRRYYDS